MPVHNEQDCIVECLDSLLDCDYPREKLEFIIADGASTDNTIESVRNFSHKNPDVAIKLVDNPQKTQGYGLNSAIRNLSDESRVVVRADAHSIYPSNYIAKCVETLHRVDAANVGGVMVPQGRRSVQRAVAFCMSHPLGVGNAKFHLGGYSGFVDTVYLGCFRRDIFTKVGMFDPLMTPNEDSEFNLRIRRAGEKIYIDESIQVLYFPRDNFAKLFRQYFRYGTGRCRTLKKHGRFTSLRQIMPPLLVLGTVFLGLLGFWWSWGWLPFLLYLFVLLSVSFSGVLRRRDPAMVLIVPCLMIMHYAWGLGFLYELCSRSFLRNTGALSVISA